MRTIEEIFIFEDTRKFINRCLRMLSEETEQTYGLFPEDVDYKPSMTSHYILNVDADKLILVVAMLKMLPDNVFPRGKWATIQHLESYLEGV